MSLTLLAGLGLALLASSGGKPRKPAPKGESEAERLGRIKAQIAKESSEIVFGDRQTYSDDDIGPDLTPHVDAIDKPVGGNTATPIHVQRENERLEREARERADEALDAAIHEAVEEADRASQRADDGLESTSGPNSAALAEDVIESAENDGHDDDNAVDMVITPDEIESYAAQAAEPQPAPARIPPGYDPVGARKMAPSLARHLTNCGKTADARRSNYDRRLLETFQRKSGITPDRHYGGSTWGALLHYGGKDAPPAFFPPLQIVAYVPPA